MGPLTAGSLPSWSKTLIKILGWGTFNQAVMTLAAWKSKSCAACARWMCGKPPCGAGVNCGEVDMEFAPVVLMMDLLVSATARWARSISSSEGREGVYGVGLGGSWVGVGVDVKRGGEKSSISSSSGMLGGGGGVLFGVASASVPAVWGADWVVVGILSASDAMRSTGGRAVLVLGEGVEGVGDASCAMYSPSSSRMSGGKNCEPERWILGRGCRVPIGEGRALMLADFTLDKSFIVVGVGVLSLCCWVFKRFVREGAFWFVMSHVVS